MNTPPRDMIEETVNELTAWMLVPEEFREAIKTTLRSKLPGHLTAAYTKGVEDERERNVMALTRWLLLQPEQRCNVDINRHQAETILTPQPYEPT